MKLWQKLSVINFALLTLALAGTFGSSLYFSNIYCQRQQAINLQDKLMQITTVIVELIAKNNSELLEKALDLTTMDIAVKRLKVINDKGVVVYDKSYQVNQLFPEAISNLMQYPAILQTALIATSGYVEVQTEPIVISNKVWQIHATILPSVIFLLLLLTLANSYCYYRQLQPLKLIVHYANNLFHREKIALTEIISSPTDVNDLSLALTKARSNIKNMLKEQGDLSEALRSRAYKDEVTGLGNKRHLESQLQHILSSSEGGFTGIFCLIKLMNIQDHTKVGGVVAKNNILRDVALLLTKISLPHQVPILARVSDSEFAMVFMHMDAVAARDLADKLLEEIKQLPEQREYLDKALPFNVGIVVFDREAYLQDILRQADIALKTAQDKGRDSYELCMLPHAEYAISVVDWNSFLQGAIAEEEVYFKQQPVYFYEPENILLFHNEVLSYLKAPEGERVKAGQFFPYVEDNNLGEAFDRVVVLKICEQLKEVWEGNQRYAINLCEQSIKSDDFRRWLIDICCDLGEKAQRLNIEFPERIVQHNLAAISMLIKELGPLGVEIGLDHFGCGFSSFGYLDDLHVNYIKIDRSYIRDLDKSVDNQMIVRTFIEIAHGLGIVVIASGVETTEQNDTLLRLHVDGLQGFYVGLPA